MEPDSNEWIKALEKEYNDLMRNNAWELMERPKGKMILSSKWMFVRKRDAHGNVVRHQTRIIIKGCQQRYGVDFQGDRRSCGFSRSSKVHLVVGVTLGP